MNFFERKLKVWQYIVIMLLIAVAVMFILWKCGKTVSNPNEKPIIKTEKEIINETKIDSSHSKVIVDSMGNILDRIDTELTKTSIELLNEQDRSLMLLQENDSLRSLLSANDLTTSLNSSAEAIRENSKLKDSLCNKTLASIRKQVDLKNKIITEKDNLHSKIKKQLDSCGKGITSLQKENKKQELNNKVAFGFVGNFYPDAGIGAGVTFIHKKGWVVNTDAMRMNNNWYIGLGIKKVLSFKK